MDATFVIVGGGIAGVSCAETLAFLEPNEKIVLVSESSLIKTVTNLHAITRTLVNFKIEEQNTNYLSSKYSNVVVIHDSLKEVNDREHFIVTVNKNVINYKFLCLCMGAVPKLIPQSHKFPDYIIGIRDTDSVDCFIQKLKTSRRAVVVGNGGIASELVFKMKNIDTHWVIKDKHITATFIDPGAAEFFQSTLNNNPDIKTQECVINKRMRYSEDEFKNSGAALGPDWYKDLFIQGNCHSGSVKISYGVEVSDVKNLQQNSDFAIEVLLNNGEKIACDIVVSATGVTARSSLLSNLEKSEDGGIKVNEFMQTSLQDVYAAGDVCCANWNIAKHWFQMKLWTQARQMGCYAAKSMSGHFKKEVVLQDFCFEMFAHSTRLFGYKVILLGLFNGQKLGSNYEILLRMTKNKEYIKFVLQDNKLQGAILIGETDLEEMAENLILNQLDLSPFGDDILNPDIDIEDYFD